MVHRETSHLRPPLRKALGQHHLVDGALTRPLVSFLRPRGERVLEVGPGGGVLTAELLAAGAAAVFGWELDPAWAAALGRRMAGESRLRLVVADALALPWERLPAPTLVAGNLPYAIATTLVIRMLAAWERLPRAAFLVQREVAERLVAGPGESAYGALSVRVAARSRARLLGRVKAGSFQPPPKVESAFVGFELTPPPLPEAAMAGFEDTVHLAFGRRRKTLRNALGAGWGRPLAAAALETAEIPPSSRAEELSLASFLDLHRAYLELRPAPAQPDPRAETR